MIKEYDLHLDRVAKVKPLLAELLLPETLLRLNPHWILDDLSVAGGGFEASLKDHETSKPFELAGVVSLTEDGWLKIDFEDADYSEILLFIKDDKLQAKVDFTLEEDDLTEATELQLVLWLRAIKEYLRMYSKNSIYAKFFQYIMDRIILKMTPSQRKISLMLIRITVVEIFVILLIVIGYVIFVLKPVG